MSDETSDGRPAELGAEMDYDEHERTYAGFLMVTKYGTLICAALLIAMAFGFFTSAGLVSSFVLFAAICAAGYYLA